MKRYLPALVIVAAVLLPACCVHSGVRHPTRSTLGQQLEQKTVALVQWRKVDEEGNQVEVTPDTEGAEMKPYCAGVWISKDTFVTARHCIADAGKPTSMSLLEQLLQRIPPELKQKMGVLQWDPTNQPVTYASWGDVVDEPGPQSVVHTRTSRPARIVAVDADHDLALVRAGIDETSSALPNHLIAELATGCHVGDDVSIMGHPIGLWWSYTHGWISQVRLGMLNVDEKPVDVLQISAPVWFGNSGGGVFNSQGDLLGISSWLVKAPNTAFFVKYDVVSSFLNHNGIKTAVGR